MDHTALPNLARLWTQRTLVTGVLRVGGKTSPGCGPWSWGRNEQLGDSGLGDTGLRVANCWLGWSAHDFSFPLTRLPRADGDQLPTPWSTEDEERPHCGLPLIAMHHRHRPGRSGVAVTVRRWNVARKISGSKHYLSPPPWCARCLWAASPEVKRMKGWLTSQCRFQSSVLAGCFVTCPVLLANLWIWASDKSEAFIIVLGILWVNWSRRAIQKTFIMFNLVHFFFFISFHTQR